KTPTPHPNPPPHGGREQDGDLLAVLKAQGVRSVLVRNTRNENDAHADFYAGWDELFDARPDPADRSPTDALLRTLPAVLDRLAGSADWLLWVETDCLLPPWDVRQDVFDVYVQDLIEDDEDIPEDEGAVIEDGSEYADDYGPEVETSGWEHEAPAELEPAEDEEDDTDEDEPEPVEPQVEPVPPWTDPPTGWFDKDDLASWELLHRSFAAVVTVFDADLGRVFELFRARGLDRSAAWVLTADRGLPLGEHGLIGPHRPWLHEELVHVPLIVRLPDAAEAGRRIPALTQPADLMPTLAAWLGAEGLTAADGVSLLPLLTGKVESVRPIACSGLVLGETGEWAIRTPEWALLLPARPHPDDEERREPMLFEKPDDRWEVNDLRPRNLERAEELEAVLRQAVERVA
ncbi:MAG TPA: sulfatase-like hydrolase/transferase, partial [Fimbriiglobus sp.]|nr:sulfatase-like hydrolase/transferase [Fimbriiglobus sp.]